MAKLASKMSQTVCFLASLQLRAQIIPLREDNEKVAGRLHLPKAPKKNEIY